MQKTHIWSNPSYQRSLIQPVVVRSELNEYLDLTFAGTNNKKVKVFKNMEYKFSFYDASYGIQKIVTGLVTDVYPDQIKIICSKPKKVMVDCSKCLNKDKCNKAKDHNLPPMPICNCILNPPDLSKYDAPISYFIPLENLMDVSYIMNTNTQQKPKGGTKVMILGISAEIVKAIVIRMEFFDDNIEEAVKYVELQNGEIYDIVYESEGSIFENRVKVVNIEECSKDAISNGESTIVRENIGFDNSVHDHHCKVDFMKEPPVRKIAITVDTSETFDGNLEIIMLDQIRDCTKVKEDSTIDTVEELADSLEWKTEVDESATIEESSGDE